MFVAYGGGKNTPRHISATRWDRNKIPTPTPNFDDDHSNGTIGETVRCDRTLKIQDGGLWTFKMYISACTQDSNDIPTAIPMFLGCNYQMRIFVWPNRKKLEVENQRWRPFIWKYLYLILVDKIRTRFQLINLCFRLFGIQQSNGTNENNFQPNRK